MKRGEVWLATVGAKRRPVVVLSRDAVIDVRQLVTVAEVTTTTRGLRTEVPFDALALGLDEGSVVNADGLHTIPQRTMTGPIGRLDALELVRLCAAVNVALGC